MLRMMFKLVYKLLDGQEIIILSRSTLAACGLNVSLIQSLVLFFPLLS